MVTINILKNFNLLNNFFLREVCSFAEYLYLINLRFYKILIVICQLKNKRDSVSDNCV